MSPEPSFPPCHHCGGADQAWRVPGLSRHDALGGVLSAADQPEVPTWPVRHWGGLVLVTVLALIGLVAAPWLSLRALALLTVLYGGLRLTLEILDGSATRESARSELELWPLAMGWWSEEVYCARCDAVYIPGREETRVDRVPPVQAWSLARRLAHQQTRYLAGLNVGMAGHRRLRIRRVRAKRVRP